MPFKIDNSRIKVHWLGRWLKCHRLYHDPEIHAFSKRREVFAEMLAEMSRDHHNQPVVYKALTTLMTSTSKRERFFVYIPTSAYMTAIRHGATPVHFITANEEGV